MRENQKTDKSPGKAEADRLRSAASTAAVGLIHESDLLRALMDNSPDYIFFKDRASRFIRTNRAHAQQLLGLADPQEAVGKTDFDLFPQEDAQRFYDEEQRIMESGQPVVGKEWQVRADRSGRVSTGETVWLSEHKIPITDETGQVIGLVGISRDITERRQVQEALQEANYALQRRAIHLEASAEVGQAITSIFDVNELLRKVVDLVRDHFGFYHAGIFLMDETGEWAVLREATGEAGAQMKAQGHRLAVGDTSMVGWTAAHRQPRIALYAEEDQVRFPNPLLPYTRSEMTLPLVVGGRILGVLNVQSTEEAAFDEDDVRSLQSMANQIIIAIENARQISEGTTLLERVSPIYRASRRLTTVTTTKEAADAIIASVAETGADGCIVVEFEFSPADEPEALMYLGVWRRDREPQFRPGTRLPIIESPFPLEMVSTLWTVADVEQDKRLPQSARQIFMETGAKALVNIPLHAREKVIGQVVVLRATPGPFRDTDLRLYEALSDLAAVALERAQLLEEAQRRAEQEQLARQMVDRIRRAVNIEQALQTTAEELSHAMRVPHVSIELSLEAPMHE